MSLLPESLFLLSLFALNVESPTSRPSGGPSPADSVPPGVEMLLPRGGIPAVFEPRFVAPDVSGLPDSAWVLGIEVGGEAHAYSLNLLNGHEVVNDSIGGRAIAAVW